MSLEGKKSSLPTVTIWNLQNQSQNDTLFSTSENHLKNSNELKKNPEKCMVKICKVYILYKI